MPMIVAEIGCNHMGQFPLAEEMIRTAASFCKADFAKFQKRNAKELLSPTQYCAPHPNPQHAYGATYGEHREALEFSIAVHRDLQQLCRDVGIGYACSVWDLTSAREIASLEPTYIKIPSASNLHWPMLDFLTKEYTGEVHISLGMTRRSEEDQLGEFLAVRGRLKDVVLYACTSGYPVDFEQLCLREITRLSDKFGGQVKAIGFSGHHLGIAADIAAMTLGAQWIERHFTLDRTSKGSDHAASLEPDGLRKLCRDRHAVARALQYKSKDIMDIEIAQRQKLKWDPVRHG